MGDRRKNLETIAAILREESTLALATTDEQGRPCVAPVYYIAGEELTLFWLSAETSLHSRNLKRAPMAAAAIYRHTAKWKEIRGVQLRGPVTVARTRRWDVEAEDLRRPVLIRQRRIQLALRCSLTCRVAVQLPCLIRYPGAAWSALRPTAAAPALVLLVAGSEKYREAERSSDHRARVLM